jgi:pSer/pThr/pTyr-binding forkhead associated (FHA) protein
MCSRGHFNDPRSRFCSSCGISMVHQTQNLVPGPRPPLGVIVFEDGTTYSLSASYVVGRQPDSSSRVQSGEALPLTLEDSERTISRVHAELRLQDWDVHFVNLSSTNGSFVWDSGNEEWLPVTDQPVVLTPGTRISFGRRTAVFESALVR